MSNDLSQKDLEFADGMARLAITCDLAPVDLVHLVGRMTQPMSMMLAMKNGISAAEASAVFGTAFDEGVALGMPITQPMFDAILRAAPGGTQ